MDNKKIKNILSDCELPVSKNDIDNLVELDGGSRSSAIKIGDYIFKFPKNDSVLEAYNRDSLIMDVLKKYLSKDILNKIPNSTFVEDKKFSYSKKLKGKMVSPMRAIYRDGIFYKDLSEKQKNSIAKNIAKFFNEMHQVPLSEIKKINKKYKSTAYNWDSSDVFDYVLGRKLLLRQTKNRVDLNDFKTKLNKKDLVFTHNDLSGSNILIDVEKDDSLNAILDFGNADITPRIYDFFPLYKIDREFGVKTIEHYNKISFVKVDIKELDYLCLVYLGNLLCEQHRKKKAHWEFVKVLLDFFADSYGRVYA